MTLFLPPKIIFTFTFSEYCITKSSCGSFEKVSNSERLFFKFYNYWVSLCSKTSITLLFHFNQTGAISTIMIGCDGSSAICILCLWLHILTDCCSSISWCYLPKCTIVFQLLVFLLLVFLWCSFTYGFYKSVMSFSVPGIFHLSLFIS